MTHYPLGTCKHGQAAHPLTDLCTDWKPILPRLTFLDWLWCVFNHVCTKHRRVKKFTCGCDDWTCEDCRDEARKRNCLEDVASKHRKQMLGIKEAS